MQDSCCEDATILLYRAPSPKSRYICEGAIAKCKGTVVSNRYRCRSARACGTETLVLAVIGVGSLEQSRKRS